MKNARAVLFECFYKNKGIEKGDTGDATEALLFLIDVAGCEELFMYEEEKTTTCSSECTAHHQRSSSKEVMYSLVSSGNTFRFPAQLEPLVTEKLNVVSFPHASGCLSLCNLSQVVVKAPPRYFLVVAQRCERLENKKATIGCIQPTIRVPKDCSAGGQPAELEFMGSMIMSDGKKHHRAVLGYTPGVNREVRRENPHKYWLCNDSAISNSNIFLDEDPLLSALLYRRTDVPSPPDNSDVLPTPAWSVSLQVCQKASA
jgi:hypothetical protein